MTPRQNRRGNTSAADPPPRFGGPMGLGPGGFHQARGHSRCCLHPHVVDRRSRSCSRARHCGVVAAGSGGARARPALHRRRCGLPDSIQPARPGSHGDDAGDQGGTPGEDVADNAGRPQTPPAADCDRRRTRCEGTPLYRPSRSRRPQRSSRSAMARTFATVVSTSYATRIHLTPDSVRIA